MAQLKQVQSPLTRNSDLDAWFKSVRTGNFDSDLLQKNWTTLRLSHPHAEICAMFLEITGEQVLICASCDKPEFAYKTKGVYFDAYSVCPSCMSLFSMCEVCKTFVLTIDLGNPTHNHIVPSNKIDAFIHDEEVEVWNADIMESGRPMYLKTPEETSVWKHQKEAFTPTLFTAHTDIPFRYFGIELEVEKISCAPPDMIKRTRNIVKKFAMIKHDGSLGKKGKNGFEIVSVPATIAYHKSGIWDEFFDNLSQFFLSAPPSTGLHVHVGIDTIGKITTGKMLVFINTLKNREFIESVASRSLGVPSPTNGKVYAVVQDNWKISNLLSLRQHSPVCIWNPNNKKGTSQYLLSKSGAIIFDTAGHPVIGSIKPSSLTVRPVCKCAEGKYNVDKYQAFRLSTQRPTVEVRIFRGITTKDFLFSALEFVDALIDYCQEASTSQLGYRDFLAWLCRYNQSGRNKLYPNLSRYLINHGWIDPPKEKFKLESKLIANG